jgi:SAM-dependent methyltransferase
MTTEAKGNFALFGEEQPAAKPAAPASSSGQSNGAPTRLRRMGFADWNKRLAQRVESWYLQGLNMEEVYKETIQKHTEPDALILDAGAGKRCLYKREGMRVVGVDVLPCDLAENPDIGYAVVTDLSVGFPFQPQTFNAITACYFVEHIPDTESFMRDAAIALKPRGKIFLLFPCRYAPFAIFNRIIPNGWTVGLLRRFLKESQGGFPAQYSRCWPNGMQKVLEQNGFRIIFQKVCHYQAFYCAAFLPLYLLCLTYDAMTRATGIKALASSVIMVAEKIDQGCSEAASQQRLHRGETYA